MQVICSERQRVRTVLCGWWGWEVEGGGVGAVSGE